MAKSSRRSQQQANPPGRLRRWTVRLFIYSLVAGLLGTIALIVAVGVAASNLPSFEELRRSPNGQAIRVRDTHGQIIVSIGPK